MAVENRGPYQWRARIRRTGFPTQSKTFETKSEADAWERMILSEMDRGVFSSRKEAEATTLLECLERYAKEIVPAKKGAAQDLSRIEVLKRLPLVSCFMSSIRGSDMAAMRDQMLHEGKSPSTVVKYLAVISHLFNIARKEWGMESLANPVELIRKPVIKNSRKRTLVKGEEQKLLKGCRAHGNPWLEPLVILAIETAMRKGELLGMSWRNVNLKDNFIFLSDTSTKNGESREVPLTPRAINTLKDIRRNLPLSISGKVFSTTSYATRKAFIKVCKDAVNNKGEPEPIKDLRFHDLRHEATTRLAPQYDAQELAKITGHKDLKMILRYYHPTGKDLAKRLN